MDTKEIKSALKAAREAIRNKEFKEALRHCKAILKHDKNNYNALVFVGVSAEGLEQPDQAVAAYKRAIEAEPGNPLAWQGLSSFYEKSNNEQYRNDMVEVYEKLIQLFTSDSAKKQDLTMKLAETHKKLGNVEKALETYHEALQGDDDGAARNMWIAMINLLNQQQELNAKQLNMLEKAYGVVLHNTEDNDQQTQGLWAQYINFLVSHGCDVSKLKAECEVMRSKFPVDTVPLEVLAQLSVDNIAIGGQEDTEVENFTNMLSQLQEVESPWSNMLLAVQNIQNNNYTQTIAQCKQGIQKVNNFPGPNIILAKAQLHNHDVEGTLSSVSKARKLLEKKGSRWSQDKNSAVKELQLLQVQAAVQKGTRALLEGAVDTCEQMLKNDPKSRILLYNLARAQLKLENTEKSKEAVNMLMSHGEDDEVLVLQGQYELMTEQYDQAVISLQKAVSLNAENGEAQHYLARMYWTQAATDENKKDLCFQTLLKAAKLDPYFARNFLYLGHYYSKFLNDKVRAKRCYQKAFDLDSYDEECGAALVDALTASGDEELAGTILQNVTSTSSAGSAKWAWLRLGLQQLRQDNPSQSIASFQSALRADPKDRHIWECLGEAYMNRGSYTAALKAFTRATELNTEAMYCYYQIAAIKQTLGLNTEAIDEYARLLEKEPNYVPALKGLGETHISQARSYMSKFFHGRAIDHCEAAIKCLTKAASGRPDMSCLWKLLGDACTILYPIPENSLKIIVPDKLLGTSDEGNDSGTEIAKTDLLALGTRCYGMALKQYTDNSSLWHDLGVNLYYRSQMCPGPSAQQLIAKAVNALQKAVSLQPTNHRHWTALGAVAASKGVDYGALAQHCFIKSTQLEANNVVAWTNLGTLYLAGNFVEQAHEAFKVAQSLDPGYVASWIGQALIAETVGHSDAMDLFRHTTELGFHVEGSIGYAHWVCQTLKEGSQLDKDIYKYSIEKMAAIPAASDALARYTERITTDPKAYNLYGLLLERQNLYKTAAEMLNRALLLFEKQKDEANLESAKANYARILCAMKNYDEGLSVYKSLKKLSFEDYCQMGAAFYTQANYDDSKYAYEQALNLAPNDEDKSHVFAALGMVKYKDGDIEGAKSALFSSSQMSPASVNGLKALCSLGLTQGDLQLAGAVMQELASHVESNDEHLADYAAFCATMIALQGSTKEGRNVLLSWLHRHPDKASLWLRVSRYLLEYESVNQKGAAATCARAAVLKCHAYSQKTGTLIGQGSLGGGFHSQQNPEKSSLSFAVKAIHKTPDNLEAWCSLLSVVFAELVIECAVKGNSKLEKVAPSLATHLMSKVESELQTGPGGDRMQALHLWCVKQYIVILLALGRYKQAQQFVQQAAWLYESDSVLQSLSAVFQQDFKSMRNVAHQDNNGFVTQVLAESLIQQGLLVEAEKVLKQSIENARSRPAKIACLLQLCHVSYQQIQADPSKNGKWQPIFDDTCNQLLSVEPHCPAVLLMRGLLQLTNKKTGPSKRNLQESINVSRSGECGWMKSVTRKHMLDILLIKPDEEAIQNLVKEAADDNDKDFLDYYNSKRSTP